MTVELRDYSDDELRAIPPLKVGYNHLRNPFHNFADSLGMTLANRWAWIHWPKEMARENGQDASGEVDPFEAMQHTLAVKRSGFHRAEGPQGFALFPSVPNFQPGSDAQRKAEAEWESRCQDMHENQEHITLAAKPTDKNYRPTRIVSDLDGEREPMKYEDYVRMTRGD